MVMIYVTLLRDVILVFKGVIFMVCCYRGRYASKNSWWSEKSLVF